MLTFIPLQTRAGFQGPLHHLPYQKIDFFTDWSSVGSRSPPVVLPMQSVPIEETSITPGMGDICEAEQATSQPSQPILQRSHLNATGQAVQVDLPLVQDTFRQSPERSNVPQEEIMTNIGRNTLDVVIEPAVGILRTPHIEATTQTLIPTVEVLLPPGIGDNALIPHVSLSISGYEPDSLRTSGIRSPHVRAREVSRIPQLDGPRSLPTRDLTRGRMSRLSGQIEQESSQGGTYMQKATAIRRREYPEEGDGNDNYGRPPQDQRPPDRGGYPNRGGRPPDKGGHPGGGPPDGGGGPWTLQRTRTTRPSRTSWAHEANNCKNSSGNLGHHSIRTYI